MAATHHPPAPTEARIDANRENAKKSTGPRTAQGNAAYTRNGLKATAPELAVPPADPVPAPPRKDPGHGDENGCQSDAGTHLAVLQLCTFNELRQMNFRKKNPLYGAPAAMRNSAQTGTTHNPAPIAHHL